MGFLTSSVQIKKDKPVFIDFWATWCGPCRMISPFFEKLAGEVEGAEFYKVDVDDQPEIAQEVAIRAVSPVETVAIAMLLTYTQMPTFMAFKDGKAIGEFVGAHKNKLEVGAFVMAFKPAYSPTPQELVKNNL